jgi:hypothetical protein
MYIYVYYINAGNTIHLSMAMLASSRFQKTPGWDPARIIGLLIEL